MTRRRRSTSIRTTSTPSARCWSRQRNLFVELIDRILVLLTDPSKKIRRSLRDAEGRRREIVCLVKGSRRLQKLLPAGSQFGRSLFCRQPAISACLHEPRDRSRQNDEGQ